MQYLLFTINKLVKGKLFKQSLISLIWQVLKDSQKLEPLELDFNKQII